MASNTIGVMFSDDLSAVRFTDLGFIASYDPTDESVGYDRGPRAGIPRGVGDIRPLRGLENFGARAHNVEEIMKDRNQADAQTAAQKPPRAAVSDAEFRRRLKNISEWRKKRLAQLRAKNSR